MARHARSVDEPSRAVRRVVLAVVWLGGLTAGLFSLLAASAKYGCAPDSSGLGCTTSGSVLGFALLIVVIAVVTAATLLTYERDPRRALAVGTAAVIALLACFLVAQGILGTV